MPASKHGINGIVCTNLVAVGVAAAGVAGVRLATIPGPWLLKPRAAIA
jgi:hypothetical protein